MIHEVKERAIQSGAVTENKIPEKGDGVKLQRTRQKSDGGGEYTAVSKDGDTLEISGEGGKKNQKTEASESVRIKLSDAVLKNCSKGKLKQLLQEGRISRQQYEKLMNKFRS